MSAPGAGGGALEERLRSLILSNADGQTRDPQPPQLQDESASPSSPPTAGAGPAVRSWTSRKRPNQAQRRQMSAQLSIPIDARPQFHQSARSYAGPPGYPDQHHGSGARNRNQGPHSATFRPPSRDNGIPGAPLTGVPFVPRPRHQSSLSYHGPMSAPDRFGWSQPPLHQGNPRMPYQMPPLPHMPPMPFDVPSPRTFTQGNSHLSPTRPVNVGADELRAQEELLEGLCNTIIAGAEIEPADIMEKENFRAMIETVARSAIAEYERSQNGFHDFPPESVQLRCFGSLSSGFATKAADMDLGLLSPLSRVQPDTPGSPIPRIVEKAFLDIGLGARLLTRTRVPIIKVCERPADALRQSLLEERAKWERGAIEDTEEDEMHEDPESHPAEDMRPQARSQEGNLTREQILQSIKQAKAWNLAVYSGSAKRRLRQLGGRDVTNSNIAEFKSDDFKLLNEVCLAFVDGLADTKLRERLLRARSLSRYDLSKPNFRSLLGVFTQVEGETMAMAWESRPLREKDAAREGLAEKRLREWRAIQNKPDFGLDPLGYQKELQLAGDQLRKFASIQVSFLSQSQHEPASNYFSRALKLLHELGGHDPSSKADPVLSTMIEYYIKGIWNHDIREQVDDFTRSHGSVTLQDVGRRHKSLQLAHEYETCLKKGVYSETAAAQVRRYVELLRAAMSPTAGSRGEVIIPLPPDSSSLLSEIQLLGDPSLMAPNRPRDRYNSSLEFPKSGVGVQCDINFSAHLALQNTLLLRCYSHCDARVRPLVLFVKHWAKVRRINSPYRGTLSSYGYVLMMLHYLVNVAQPFVCPNLQQLARPPDPNLTPQQIEETVMCKGRNVRFWRDEAEIQRLARDNALTQNHESVGMLLRGFFEYYARGGTMMSAVRCRSFDWGRDVLSLRTHGGLLSKQAKGWTGAKTVVEIKSAAAPPASGPAATTSAAHAGTGSPGDITTTATTTTIATSSQSTTTANQHHHHHHHQPGPNNTNNTTVEVKEVRHRYLFAIEDPFELDHNVARTVTHAGIVKIRDEFRRAWRIIKDAGLRKGGRKRQQQEQLLQGRHGQQQQQQQQQQQGGGGGGGGEPGRQEEVAEAEEEEDLLEDVLSVEEAREREQFAKLLEELHGLGGE